MSYVLAPTIAASQKIWLYFFPGPLDHPVATFEPFPYLEWIYLKENMLYTASIFYGI